MDENLRLHPELAAFSDSSIQKMGNNLIKALAEAGYLDSPRRRNLQNVFLQPDVATALHRLNKAELLPILRQRMNDPILEYRLKQLEERIGDDRFLKNQGPGNISRFGSLIIRQSKSFRSANTRTFLFKKLDKKYTYKTLNIFQIIIDMLEERKLGLVSVSESSSSLALKH